MSTKHNSINMISNKNYDNSNKDTVGKSKDRTAIITTVVNCGNGFVTSE